MFASETVPRASTTVEPVNPELDVVKEPQASAQKALRDGESLLDRARELCRELKRRLQRRRPTEGEPKAG
jgi:hypothetical protein